ncbi:MAG: copper ion binding protein, partial [bacterium]
METKVNKSSTEKITLPIEGMHCAGCVQTVEKSLKGTQGVISASVNLSTEKAFVEYNPTITRKEDLVTAVKNAGYEVKKETKKITLKIGGMHCAACVGNVERALADTKGILEVKVNLSAEKATVIFDPVVTNVTDLKTAVENSGYQFLGEAMVETREADSEKDIQKVLEAKRRMVLAWAFTIPIM